MNLPEKMLNLVAAALQLCDLRYRHYLQLMLE